MMRKGELVTAIRQTLGSAKSKGDLPKSLKMSVSSAWAGNTPVIRVKLSPKDEFRDVMGSLENHVALLADKFNYNDSRAEFDYFDRGYYIHVEWLL
jgi:hypothetical protein